MVVADDVPDEALDELDLDVLELVPDPEAAPLLLPLILLLEDESELPPPESPEALAFCIAFLAALLAAALALADLEADFVMVRAGAAVVAADGDVDEVAP